MNKKIIIELNNDFCPKCFTHMNQYLMLNGFNMLRMQRIDDVEVYTWVENKD